MTLKIDIETLAKVVAEQGTPTEGYLAVWIWESLSGNSTAQVDTTLAGGVYERLGYRPFSGYPLVRLGQKP